MLATATLHGARAMNSRATTLDSTLVFPRDADGDTRAPVASFSDHQLVAEICQGSEAAFAELVARYRHPITNYLYRVLGDYETSVDLAQETFIRIYQARERYNTDYAFSTYIYRIASNLAISEIRRRNRRPLLSFTNFFLASDEQPSRDTLHTLEPVDVQPLPDSCMIERETQLAVQRAIATLPESYRLPLVLRDIEGKPYDEIALMLNLNLGTTKSRISRARALLKEKLTAYL